MSDDECMVCGCYSPETANLRSENERLAAELKEMTAHRDYVYEENVKLDTVVLCAEKMLARCPADDDTTDEYEDTVKAFRQALADWRTFLIGSLSGKSKGATISRLRAVADAARHVVLAHEDDELSAMSASAADAVERLDAALAALDERGTDG